MTNDVLRSVEDFTGKQVVVGDQVAVAFRLGNSSELRVGEVKGFGKKNDGYSDEPLDTMLIEWDATSGYSGMRGKTTAIHVDRGRFVRLD